MKQSLLKLSVFVLSIIPAGAPAVSAANTEAPAQTEEQVAGEAPENPLARAFKEGSAYLNLRYRYEFVDQSGFDKDGKASTLRTRLGYETGRLGIFGAKIEIEDVQQIGEDLYNSTSNDRTDRPIVADPDGTVVNEAYFSAHSPNEFRLRAGREALTLGNLRFVGDVGWRQNNQTFDGVNARGSIIGPLEMFYGYAGHVNRIFGEDSPVGDFDTRLHMLNLLYEGGPFLNATTYAYLFEVEDAPALSSATAGLRVHGAFPLSETLKALYDGELAYQQDYENNPVSYEAPYYRIQAGAAAWGLAVQGGFESLGSDGGEAAVTTPFATLHKWNGWADQFLSTPEAGLNDAYGILTYDSSALGEALDGLQLALVYHYFSSEQDSLKYGEEWDFNISKPFCGSFAAGVKFASYQAENFGVNTEKLIFSFSAAFNQ